MNSEKREMAAVKCTIKALAAMCAGEDEKIIDLLTGYLWDEEEAEKLRRFSVDPISHCGN